MLIGSFLRCSDGNARFNDAAARLGPRDGNVVARQTLIPDPCRFFRGLP